MERPTPNRNTPNKPKGIHDDRTAKQALIQRKAARDKILEMIEDKRIADLYDL
jgi:hypothetical protein